MDPAPAITPRAQGELLFEALGQTPRFKHVPVAMISAIVSGLSIAGRVSSRLRDKAELARIGHYYATESMLVWDHAAARYDADATPEFGSEMLENMRSFDTSGGLKRKIEAMPDGGWTCLSNPQIN